MEHVTLEECKREITATTEVINDLLERHQTNQNFLKGVLKFCDRVKKYEKQTSKLTSAFHTFGSETYQSKKVTTNAVRKKRLGKKIKVQPEAVKRRKTESGSKAAIKKGMIKRSNPFQKPEPNVMRPHSFSANVSSNEAVPKKAGRTMTSRTKFLSKKSVKVATLTKCEQ